MTIEIRLLQEGDAHVLSNVAAGVFDFPVIPEMAERFLKSPAHYIAVAIDGDAVIGMATANEYLHPDKPVQIWINEMGVAPAYRQQGIGKRLLRRILDLAVELGFEEIWLGTEDENVAARALYRSLDGKEESFVMYSWEFGKKGSRE